MAVKESERKADRRVRYTKLMLRQSLLELLAEKPISKITVKEICERADINRATFYAHYFDAYDLLCKIEDELIEEISEKLRISNRADILNSVKDICDVIKQNSDLCNILFGEFGSRDLMARILDLIRNNIVDSWNSPDYNIPPEEVEFIYAFATNGSVGIIRAWQQTGFTMPPLKIAEIITGLSYNGMQSYMTARQ